jgi:hypothetical protein
MQGTYNYITEIRHVSRVDNGAAFLLLRFIIDVTLFPTINVLYFYEYISTSRSTWAMLNMAVFCCSLISCFPGMLPRYVCTYLCVYMYVYYYYYYYLLYLGWHYSICVWCPVHIVSMPVVTMKQKLRQANNCPSFLHYPTFPLNTHDHPSTPWTTLNSSVRRTKFIDMYTKPTATRCTVHTIVKAITLQAWTGPEGSRRWRHPDFLR